VARWVITGEAFSGEELTRFLACDQPLHQAQCKQLAWEQYLVHIVKLRRIVDIYPVRAGII